MVNKSTQLKNVMNYSKWPPAGKRGVAFARANLYGHNFENYKKEAQKPIIIAMIENILAIKNLESILSVKGLDAILIGPYDLSASLGITGEFDNPKFNKITKKILKLSKKYKIPAGIHIVEPSELKVKNIIRQGYQFIACAMDTIMIQKSSKTYLSLFKKR